MNQINLITIKLLVLLVTSNIYIIQAQQFNRPVPNSLFPYEFEQVNQTIDTGYYFLTPMKIRTPNTSPSYKRPYALLLDSDGYIYWYSKPNARGCLDFKYYPESKTYSIAATYNQADPNFILLDSSLTYIDTINAINLLEDIHDIQQLNNGNWLISTIHIDTVDLTGYTFSGQPGKANTPIKGYGFQEIDQNGNLVLNWNSNDHIHPSETYDEYGYDSTFFDYCHGNTLEEDDDGNILISFRHLNSIYKINRLTGQVVWRLGGKSSNFTFINDSLFSGQHDIRRLDNGNYSLFDNGNMSPLPKLSRGVEYQLDTINWTATLVKEYIHPDAVYASAMGSYHTTINDFKIMGYGLIFRPSPSATIIDHSQTINTQIFLEDSVVSYRVHHFTPNLPPRPQITCEQTLAGWILNAPSASNYRWSTGENTPSIMVTQQDTVQVWIPYGSGFIGSEPLIISDINNPCGLASIEANKPQPNEAYQLYNLLGQPIKNPKPYNLYLKVYSSGITEQIIHTSYYQQ